MNNDEIIDDDILSELLDMDPDGPLVPSGSTLQAKSRVESGSIWWGIVIGNHENLNLEQLCSKCSKICKKFVFQLEKSENDYEHVQMLCAFNRKLRKTQVLKEFLDFAGPNGINNVSARKRNEKFAWYCSKEDTRIEGPWSKGFPNLSNRPVRTIQPEHFYDWQKELYDLLQAPSDDRSVFWYYDSGGNKGKTAFAKYLVVHHKAFLFRGGANDMASRIIMEGAPKIAIMNLARTQENYVSYQTIEEIKDGLMCSGKYEGGQIAFDAPHLIVFANYPPDSTKLSTDRWKIVNLDDENEEYSAAAHFVLG